MPPKRLNITGREQVVANMNREIRRMMNGCSVGLVRGAMLVKRDAVPAAPIDTGNLRASAYVVVNGEGVDVPSPNFSNRRGDAAQQQANHAMAIAEARYRTGVFSKLGVLGEVGFTTTYAARVHETHRTHSKFLENALKANASTILELIRSGGKIK